MKWAKAHKMRNLKKVIKKFKKDGQNKRAAMVMFLQNPLHTEVISKVIKTANPELQISSVTELAQAALKHMKQSQEKLDA